MRKTVIATVFFHLLIAGSSSAFDLRGFVSETIWRDDNGDHGSISSARLLGDATLGDSFAIELNAVAVSAVSTLVYPGAGVTVERSPDLRTDLKDDPSTTMFLALDRVNARYTHDRVDIIAGRQVINLATCYYFTPNDFFAPFSANTFFRVYKPGVDALRIETRLGDLTQLTIAGVAGYTEEVYDPNRNSYISRVTTVLGDYEFALLGGSVAGDDFSAAAIQGELPIYAIGLRAEGNVREGDIDLSIQLGKRFESTLDIKMEYYHHGSSQGLYYGERYIAIGAGYEVTPLLIGQILALVNADDDSRLYSLYGVYSLSDESELSFSVSIPQGADDTEFGIYPASSNAEWRWYF